MKVLIADDEDMVRSIMGRIAQRLGHQVVEAADGAMAWDEILRERPRIVISDWEMPHLSGMDLCSRVRQRNDGDYIYFILVSGAMLSPENYQTAFENGVDDFLMKPIKGFELNNRLMVANRILGLTKRVHDLEGFVPICSYCKRIRSDDGTYQALETYVYKHSQMNFSHGVCPDCMATKVPKEHSG